MYECTIDYGEQYDLPYNELFVQINHSDKMMCFCRQSSSSSDDSN